MIASGKCLFLRISTSVLSPIGVGRVEGFWTPGHIAQTRCLVNIKKIAQHFPSQYCGQSPLVFPGPHWYSPATESVSNRLAIGSTEWVCTVQHVQDAALGGKIILSARISNYLCATGKVCWMTLNVTLYSGPCSLSSQLCNAHDFSTADSQPQLDMYLFLKENNIQGRLGSKVTKNAMVIQQPRGNSLSKSSVDLSVL